MARRRCSEAHYCVGRTVPRLTVQLVVVEFLPSHPSDLDLHAPWEDSAMDGDCYRRHLLGPATCRAGVMLGTLSVPFWGEAPSTSACDAYGGTSFPCFGRRWGVDGGHLPGGQGWLCQGDAVPRVASGRHFRPGHSVQRSGCGLLQQQHEPVGVAYPYDRGSGTGGCHAWTPSAPAPVPWARVTGCIRDVNSSCRFGVHGSLGDRCRRLGGWCGLLQVDDRDEHLALFHHRQHRSSTCSCVGEQDVHPVLVGLPPGRGVPKL